jgi:hypothetical protein
MWSVVARVAQRVRGQRVNSKQAGRDKSRPAQLFCRMSDERFRFYQQVKYVQEFADQNPWRVCVVLARGELKLESQFSWSCAQRSVDEGSSSRPDSDGTSARAGRPAPNPAASLGT